MEGEEAKQTQTTEGGKPGQTTIEANLEREKKPKRTLEPGLDKTLTTIEANPVRGKGPKRMEVRQANRR